MGRRISSLIRAIVFALALAPFAAAAAEPPPVAPVAPGEYTYYCPRPAGYYPAVPACEFPWQAIPRTAPPGAAVTPTPPGGMPGTATVTPTAPPPTVTPAGPPLRLPDLD